MVFATGKALSGVGRMPVIYPYVVRNVYSTCYTAYNMYLHAHARI